MLCSVGTGEGGFTRGFGSEVIAGMVCNVGSLINLWAKQRETCEGGTPVIYI